MTFATSHLFWTRRQLLSWASGLASTWCLAGCRGRSHPGAYTTPEEAEMMLADRADRKQLLSELEGTDWLQRAVFTTPKRPEALLKSFPELKNLQRLTHRLHPQALSEPAADESKIGGQFCWPGSEPWPLCETFKIPYVPVLQLRSEDAPTQLKYKPGSDLLQLLWSPRLHQPRQLPKPLLVWRNRREVIGSLAELPNTDYALFRFVPVPCRITPEPVLEFPDWETVQVTPFREKLLQWHLVPPRDPVEFYRRELSTAPGTKVGGYPYWLSDKPVSPSCETCRRGMDFLLTLDSREWREPSWIPSELKDVPIRTSALDSVTGLRLPTPGNVHLFVCRRCEDWPAQLTN